MNKLLFISTLIFFVVNCSVPQIMSNENQLMLSKKYIGQYDTCIYLDKKYAKVYTSYEIIEVKLDGDTIPKNALCYIQLVPIQLAGQLSETYRVFFTWDGTDKLYTVNEEELADK